MTDLGRSIKIGSDHLDAMKMRRERLIATVGDCMSKEDLDKELAEYNEKLEQLAQILQRCGALEHEMGELDKTEADMFSDAEKLKKEQDLQITFDRPPPPAAVAVAPAAAPADGQARVARAPLMTVRSRSVTPEQKNRLLQKVSDGEMASVSNYMRGRLSTSDVNEVITKMNEFLTMKCRLLAAPYHKLVPKDKDLVTKWKEQDTGKTDGAIYCYEADVRPLLSEKSKSQLKNVLPILRHLKRTREIRDKSNTIILPISR